jgi:tetratricopeptide (TPR) repeat protein
MKVHITFCDLVAALLVLLLLLPLSLVAEEPNVQVEATLNEAAVVTPVLPLIQLEEAWDEVLEAVLRQDLSTVNELVLKIETIKLGADVRALDSYALFFLEQGRRFLRDGKNSDAAFYTRKALQLSPDSPLVLARALPLVRQTSSTPILPIVGKILKGVWQHPNVALRVVQGLLYPVLIAGSMGLLIAFMLLFASKIEVTLRNISKPLPSGFRGILAPLVLLFILVFPLPFGPLWTLSVWALLLYVTLPNYRWMGFFAGALIVAWGTVVPVRESLERWLDNPGIQAMIDTISGDYHHGAPEKLKALSMQRNDDGALHYALGQSLRRNGDYEGAENAFLRAEMILGKQPWTTAQRGLVAFLSGRTKAADELMSLAEKQGLTTPAHYFNWSKIKFELLDTQAARDLLGKAVAGDTDLTRTLQKREDLLGTQAQLAIAEITLPFRLVLASALMPTMHISDSFNAVAFALMPGLEPPGIAIMGSFILLLFFAVRERKTRSTPLSSYIHLFPSQLLRKVLVCIPGGAWILCGRPLVCAAILSVCAFLAMPLMAWPTESIAFVHNFPDFMPYYLSFFILLSLSTCYVGAHLEN